jgi:multiple sugar transport system substrate-binding protein
MWVMKSVLWRILVIILLAAGCAVNPTAGPLPTASTPEPTPAATATIALPPMKTVSPVVKPTQKPASTQETNASQIRGTRISFWFPASGDLENEYSAEIAEFNQTNIWGITVEGRPFLTTTQLEAQVNAQPQSLPNVVSVPLEMLLTWQAQSQVVYPLDELIHDPEWGLTSQETADILPVFWNEEKDDQRWGIPAERNTQVLFYNVSWAQALGFQRPPATPDEFKTQACAAMKANVADENPENDGTGGWILSNDPLVLESWRMAFGGEPLPVQEGQPYIFNNPASVSAFTFLKSMVDANCAWTARNPAPYPYFAQRQALFYSGSLLDLPFQARAMDFAKSSDRWTVLEYPSPQGPPVVMTSGNTNAVLRSTAAGQLASWLFIRYLMLPRVQSRLAAVGGLIPTRQSAVESMSIYRQNNAQWAQVAGWLGNFHAAPHLASWRTVRRILQDAAWQIFSPIVKVDGIPGVLDELDGMIKEIINKP